MGSCTVPVSLSTEIRQVVLSVAFKRNLCPKYRHMGNMQYVVFGRPLLVITTTEALPNYPYTASPLVVIISLDKSSTAVSAICACFVFLLFA